MALKEIVSILLLTWTLTSAQFLYNYEQENPETEEPEQYNPSEYKYNPPSAVERHFLRTSQISPARTEQPQPRAYEAVEIPVERPRRRQHSTPRRQRPQPAEVIVEDYARENYQQSPEYMQEVRAEPLPEERPGRQSRNRQSRPTPAPAIQIYEPPKYYGPSAFENIPLGHAPSGVFVPHDSLLNLIKERPSYSPRSQPAADQQYAPESNAVNVPAQPIQSVAVYRPEPYFVTAPPTLPRTSYVEPVVNYISRPEPQPIIEPEQPEEYVEQLPPPPPQRSYRPSNQEVQQNEYRRQRRVQRPQAAPQPRPKPAPQPRHQPAPQPRPRPAPQPRPRPAPQPRPQPSPQPRAQPAPQPRPRPQRRSRHQNRPVPQSAVEYQEPPPPQPISSVEEVEEYPDDIRRSARRSQDVPPQPRRRQQVSEPVAASGNKRQRTSDFKPANLAIATLPDDDDEDGIPGVAGVDYPTLHVIPSTSFSCSSQPHSGYYADLETSCQVVHLCQSGGVKDSFLCPNGTIFSQEKFACQWWYKVNCQNSPRFYSINDQLYKVPEVKKKNEKERS